MKKSNITNFPVTFTYEELKKTVLSIKLNQFTPKVFYPTIDDIDQYIINRSEGIDHNSAEDVRFLLWNILYGYDKDELWHSQNPDCNSGNVYDMIKYVFRPAENKTGLLHTNVWGYNDTDEEAEDKEAAFEYMQDIITDTQYFKIDIDLSITDELYYEVLLRTYFKNDILKITINDGNITIHPTKFSQKEEITAQSYSTLFYFWFEF